MIAHTTLNKLDFAAAMKETETFAGFPKFKKGIVTAHKNVERLLEIDLQMMNH